jgi:FixJ family two-component response regulator
MAVASAAPASNPGTVYVVDDDKSIRRLLAWLMEREGFSVKSFAGAEDFLRAVRSDGPACLLLDLTLGGMSGLDVQSQLKRDHPDLPVVFISATAEVPHAVEAVKHGAIDFVVKPFDYKKLLELTRRCIGLSAEALARRKREKAALNDLAALTPREREVMDHVVAGKLNRIIATEMNVSIKTVEVHRARIMEKLHVNSVADLVRLSMIASSVRTPD